MLSNANAFHCRTLVITSCIGPQLLDAEASRGRRFWSAFTDISWPLEMSLSWNAKLAPFPWFSLELRRHFRQQRLSPEPTRAPGPDRLAVKGVSDSFMPCNPTVLGVPLRIHSMWAGRCQPQGNNPLLTSTGPVGCVVP